MSQRFFIVVLPLVAGLGLISIAVLNLAFPGGTFILVWMGSFLVLYGLSFLVGSRVAMSLSGVILVAGSLGDMTLLGGMNPVDWIITNYMVFVHTVLGVAMGNFVRAQKKP